MTRSLMVLKISEYLVEPRGETIQEQADNILKMIEKNGMLPPPVKDWPSQEVPHSGYFWEGEYEEK